MFLEFDLPSEILLKIKDFVIDYHFLDHRIKNKKNLNKIKKIRVKPLHYHYNYENYYTSILCKFCDDGWIYLSENNGSYIINYRENKNFGREKATYFCDRCGNIIGFRYCDD